LESVTSAVGDFLTATAGGIETLYTPQVLVSPSFAKNPPAMGQSHWLVSVPKLVGDFLTSTRGGCMVRVCMNIKLNFSV
jgi:hypothetical protein